MSRSKEVFVIGAFTLAYGASLSAIHERKTIPASPNTATLESRKVPDASLRASTTATSLRVENVRLEAAPQTEAEPATLVKFDVVNISPQRLTDLLLEISVTEKPALDPLTPRQTLVHPFQIRGDAILESGYTITYEMQLRHFSSDCNCVAHVEVLSVRSLPDSN